MALTRITKGVIKPNENYDTHNINSTGIVTATGLDISGNASIGGVLTYEDVTSIDSVGIITARDGIHVGAGVSAVGVGTFSGLDISGDLDVDGHTNLDNVSIAGVTTTTGNVNVGVDLDVTDDITLGGELNMLGSSDNNKYFDARIGSSNKLIFRSSSGGAGNLVTMLQLGVSASSLVGNLTLADSTDTSSAAGPEFTLNRNSASPANADYLGQIKFAGRSSTGVQRNYAKITGKILDVTNGAEDGILEFAHIKNGSQVITGRWRSDSLQLLNDTNLSVAGYTTLTGDLDVDGHTNLDNASIAGVATVTGMLNAAGNITIPESITHSGDDDTKIRFNNANVISFETAGADRFALGTNEVVVNDPGNDIDFRVEGDTNANLLKVDATHDRIGVGVAAPQQVFHVYHASDNGLALFESGDSQCRIDLKDNSGQASVEAIGDQLRFGTSSSNTERLRISSNGNVYFAGDQSGNNRGIIYNGPGYMGFFASSASATNREIRFFSNSSAAGETLRISSGGNVAIYKDLDVDGHTNLDNVSVAGVSTHSDHIHLLDNKRLRLGSAASGDAVFLHDGTDTILDNQTGGLLLRSGTHKLQALNANDMIVGNAGGSVELYHNNIKRLETSSVGVSIPQDLDVDGHTNLDNVSIAGVTTASGSIIVAGGGGQLKLFHQSNVDKMESTSAGFHIRQINNGDLHIHAGANSGSANNRLVARAGGKAELYYGGNLKLSTETGGVNITGVCTATTFVGDLTGEASQVTIGNGANNRIITASGTNTLDCAGNFTFGGNVMELGASGSDGGALYINGGTLNNPGGRDAKVWIEDGTDNDWAMHINKPSHNYGIQMAMSNSASHAFYVVGGGAEKFRLTGSGEIAKCGSIYPRSANSFDIGDNGTSRWRNIYSEKLFPNGLIIGDTANRLVWGITPALQVNGTTWNDSSIAIHNFGNNTNRPTLLFTKGRSGTLGDFGTPVNAGEGLGIIGWSAHDSTDAENLACYIQGISESAPTTNNQYGAITFSTVNGGTSAYERLRITSNGRIEIGTGTGVFGSAPIEVKKTSSSGWGDYPEHISLVDQKGYNEADNGGGIVFSGKYNSSGSQTTFGGIHCKKANTTDGNYGGILTFNTREHANSNFERMRIDSLGRVFVNSVGATTPTADYRSLNLVAHAHTEAGVSFSRSSSTMGSGSTAGKSIILLSDGALSFQTHNVGERLRITSDGRIGINNTSPSSGVTLDISPVTGENSACIRLSSNANNGYSELQFGRPNDTLRGNLYYNHTHDKFVLYGGAGQRDIAEFEAPGTTAYMGVGNYLSGSSNNGSWGARFNLYATDHSKLELYQQSNGVKLAAWVHVGHTRGYIGTLTNHDLYLHTANDTTKSIVINTEGQYTAQKQPSFAAYRNQNPYTANGTIIFNSTRHNTGGHYDTSNGRFTAPVAGSYQLNFYTIYRYNHSSGWFSFYKNGSRIMGGDIHFTHKDIADGNWDNVAFSQVLYLSANDYVTVVAAQNTAIHGNHWQCFSGYLLG